MPMDGRTMDVERFVLEHLDAALAQGHVKVYVQPVIRTVSRQVCGFEALARWEDPERGLLMPNQFIDVLERHRRIHELDSYVIRQVCEHLGRWKGKRIVPVSVNLSRLDYELCDIFEVVESAVRANKVHRGNLCIEITESILADNEELMRRHIERFRAAGYPVWMDDFGSGYSSLNVLKDFEFDELKIDMRFLSDFHPRSKKILASIVHMAKQIGIQTLAEGVETETQYQFLRNIGCEKIQGYLFGKPMPYGECVRHLEDQGLKWEPPALRAYYDTWGRVDVLSATPFATDGGDKSVDSGRELNSIPLAILEMRGDAVELAFTNLAFEATASALDWQVVLDRAFRMEDGIPLNRMSRHLSHLLEETRTAGLGRMLQVFNNDYYELRAKRIAAHADRCAILIRVINLSKSAELDNQKKLDDGLRSLYSVYEQVALIDLETKRLSLLYMDADAQDVPPEEGLEDYLNRYAATRIFPEDRARYLRFTRPNTMNTRVEQTGTGSITIHLRTLSYHGTYVWKCYLLVRIKENNYYMLVRDASGEVREFQSAYKVRPEEDGQKVTPEILWANAVHHSSLKFFWKDRERRFLGASRSFLEYYGFKSLDEILGRTDEDMGWHIHPDLYKSVELNVINEGITSKEVVGTCLVRGQNKNIEASKMPLYNRQGEIVGLIGFFSQVDDHATGREGVKQARIDDLTGLLNSRAIYEDLYAYIDEYQLRQTDFVRIEVAIDDFATVNARYGYDFGDEVIRRTGQALLSCCGSNATVGRTMGCFYTVLTQFEDRAALEGLIAKIRHIPAELRTIQGVSFGMYLSVGYAVYSESENKDSQAMQAEMRRMTDDVENISRTQLRENTSRIFQMYDNLPMAYAVYKLVEGKKRSTDAILLYANEEYCQLVRKMPEQLVGRRVSRLFPMQRDEWYDMAVKAGTEGERVTQKVYYSHLDLHLTLNAHPVIGPGFCAFTYQAAEDA